ncbi:hypothetical protein LQ757_08380 [Agromyces sp. SYSU K20354]|uniref:PH-like domain-containing protein n=1 Tax=Agromyces cavernae TaxID=2898659 RepID=UPI001E449B0D|nr:hypothetical protein [Agromyces cavernae]MCD2442293.1 hypothetical protein [Agromyces cavernae]
MDKWIGGIVAVGIVAVIAWLMYRSWRRRTVRDETLSSYPLPESIGAPTLEAEALYVATTPVGDPLERLAVQGLAFRGAAHLEVVAGGVILRVAGESTTFIPADRLLGASTASFAIDRGVEPDGLVALTWTPRAADDTEPARRVDSYLRARYPGDAAEIIRAVNDIAAAPAVPRPEHESEASDG